MKTIKALSPEHQSLKIKKKHKLQTIVDPLYGSTLNPKPLTARDPCFRSVEGAARHLAAPALPSNRRSAGGDQSGFRVQGLGFAYIASAIGFGVLRFRVFRVLGVPLRVL